MSTSKASSSSDREGGAERRGRGVGMEFRYSGPDTVTTGAQVPRPAAAAQQRFSSRLPLLLPASPGPTK